MATKLISILKRGGIAVMPTDTVLGVVAKARDRRAVARLYALRRKTSAKPFIILIQSIASLASFGVRIGTKERAFLRRVWPGAVSVILPCRFKRFEYLHRGTETLAFRVPKPSRLRALLATTGALVAPSANPEGKPTARTIAEARVYFGDSVDYYARGKATSRRPSTLVVFEKDGRVRMLR